MTSTIKAVFVTLVLAFIVVWFIARYKTGASTTSFDEYGVWNILSSSSLAASQHKSAGPADVSRLERYINYHFFGVSTDSLRIKIDVWGMMSYTKADTVTAVLISSSSQVVGDSTVVFADTLDANEDYPYIFVRVLNEDTGDAVASVDLWAHSRPVIKARIQR